VVGQGANRPPTRDFQSAALPRKLNLGGPPEGGAAVLDRPQYVPSSNEPSLSPLILGPHCRKTLLFTRSGGTPCRRKAGRGGRFLRSGCGHYGVPVLVWHTLRPTSQATDPLFDPWIH